MASKKTTVVSGRVPHNVAKEMERAGLKVPECVHIALQTKQNPKKRMEADLRSLLAEQEILASRTAHVNLMIEDYKKKLNITKSNDELKKELFVDDNEKAVQRTLEHFELARGETSLTIQDYVETKAGKRVVDIQMSKCDLTREDFMIMLFEKHDKSIQTKLDS